MLSLKAIQTPSNHALFHGKECFRRKSENLVIFCKSTDSKPNPSPPPKGDKRKQDLLALVVTLQTQKLRLNDFVDERSTYLTQFAEEASTGIEQIGENAFKELEEAGSRITEDIESQMQSFEELAESNKLEIQENDQNFADFQGQMERDRNEGLFFKNWSNKTPAVKEKTKAKEEVEKLKELTKKNAESAVRRNIYIALIGLVIIGISDVLLSPSSDWQKAAVLGIILVGLLSQLFYEQRMLSESEKEEKIEHKSKTDRE